MTDHISRADAIKAVASITMSIHLSDVICDKLLALPSADVIPIVDLTDGKTKLKAEDWVYDATPSADAVQGEWIDMEIYCNPYPPVFCVECSRCGYRVGRETFLENTFNYCPSCGAIMKGGDDE